MMLSPGSRYDFTTDHPSYRGIDSGCPSASKYLHGPSNCQGCPFKVCVFDGRKAVVAREVWYGIQAAKAST